MTAQAIRRPAAGAAQDTAGGPSPARRGGPARRSASRRPRADCTADRAGGLTFDVRLPGRRAANVRDAALLLRMRGGGAAERRADGPGREADGEGPEDVRLPLTPVEADGPLRAALPSTMTLPEGRWDAYLVIGDGEPRRLLPGLNDLRSLVDRVPRLGRTWLGVRIPYATAHGNLTVRSWQRWPHAEAGELHVTAGGVTLRGRLYGAPLAEGARLEARFRRGGADPVVAAAAAEGEEPEEGADFTARLPYAPLAGRTGAWDLWLCPGGEAGAVRVARILDDVPDKKRIFTYPAHTVSGTSGPVTVRPYYTRANDLSVLVAPEEAEAGPDAP